ncbi:MAG: type VI secretion system contractile sheath small subunit [Proteobacteria bacterium]|nr:type VI secretion system contractile sheath small subunit [Pseudomonadota bacterium]MDA1012257.1 type VI secretion system contractile sheath small subunit [Pseudomonadota bacterium]
MAESTQHKLDRVRAPRVQITYDVEIGDATQKKELPFVMAVCGDFSANPEKALPKVKERTLVNIDRDNFNSVLAGCQPRITVQAENTLQKDGTKIGADLRFKSLESFDPAQVAIQIEPLAELLAIRDKLSDLKNKMYGNDKLGEILAETLQDADKLTALGKESAKTDKDGE